MRGKRGRGRKTHPSAVFRMDPRYRDINGEEGEEVSRVFREMEWICHPSSAISFPLVPRNARLRPSFDLYTRYTRIWRIDQCVFDDKDSTRKGKGRGKRESERSLILYREGRVLEICFRRSCKEESSLPPRIPLIWMNTVSSFLAACLTAACRV